MTEKSHDERQDISEDSRNGGGSYTSTDGEYTFPDIRRLGKSLEEGYFFDCLFDERVSISLLIDVLRQDWSGR